jgi:hypothetical protein
MHHCVSRSGCSIRLTDERWDHVTRGHPELAGMLYDVLEVIDTADAIHEGASGECLALKAQSDGKHLVAVYREEGRAGFLITAFLTRRTRSIIRRRRIWPT